MGLSTEVCLTVTRYVGLIMLLSGTRSICEATTTIPTTIRTSSGGSGSSYTGISSSSYTGISSSSYTGISSSSFTGISSSSYTGISSSSYTGISSSSYTVISSSSYTGISSSSYTGISSRAPVTTSSTIDSTMTLPTTAAPTTTRATSTSNPHLFVIDLNTSCVTGQLFINKSQFNEPEGDKYVNGTCERDTEFIKTFIDQLINGVKVTTTTTPLTTTTRTSSTTTTIDTPSTKLCEDQLLRGVGIGAAAVALPFTVILLLFIFRRLICPNACRKKTGDATGTGNTDADASTQSTNAHLNPSTSITADRNMDAETDVSRPGYGNVDLEIIPDLPRKTSIFSIHEDDQELLGNTFLSFVPESRSAPESDYDKLPIARRPLETTQADGGDEDQAEYVNVLEAMDGHDPKEQEDYSNFPAISI